MVSALESQRTADYLAAKYARRGLVTTSKNGAEAHRRRNVGRIVSMR